MDDGGATVGEEEQTQEVGFLTNLAEVLEEVTCNPYLMNY